MKGKYNVVVSDYDTEYYISIERKYTILRGNSATGKSYFCKLLNAPRNDAINVDCDVTIRNIVTIDDFNTFSKLSGRILVIDESSDIFENINEYMKAMSMSDNYFILITRDRLRGLPISTKEIYELKSVKRGGKTNSYVNRIYETKEFVGDITGIVITEDSKSGNQFYKTYLVNSKVFPDDSFGIKESMGKRKISSVVENMLIEKDDNINVIVDGAAFGDEMPFLVETIKQSFEAKGKKQEVRIFTPESFEYLLCKAMKGNIKELVETYNYADVKEFFSWERYYTFLARSFIYNYTKKYLPKDIGNYADKMLEILKKEG